MLNYEVDTIYFYQCLLNAVELIIRNLRIRLSGEMFEFVCLNYLVKQFCPKCFLKHKRLFFFFCYKHMVGILTSDPHNCYHCDNKTFFS